MLLTVVAALGTDDGVCQDKIGAGRHISRDEGKRRSAVDVLMTVLHTVFAPFAVIGVVGEVLGIFWAATAWAATADTDMPILAVWAGRFDERSHDSKWEQ